LILITAFDLSLITEFTEYFQAAKMKKDVETSAK